MNMMSDKVAHHEKFGFINCDLPEIVETKEQNSFYFLWYSFHIGIVFIKQNIWFLIVLSAKSKINDSFDHHNFAGRRLVFGQPF